MYQGSTCSASGIFVDIHGGYGKKDTKLHIMSESWKIAMANCFYVTLGWASWLMSYLFLYATASFITQPFSFER